MPKSRCCWSTSTACMSLFGSPAIAGQRSLSTISSADGDAGEPAGALPLDRRHTALPFATAPPRTCWGCATAIELVWASGWEERANEHLPHLLGMPARLPFLRFSREPERADAAKPTGSSTRSTAMPASARLPGSTTRFNAACHEWAQARSAPTLLVANRARRTGSRRARRRRCAHWAQALAPR